MYNKVRVSKNLCDNLVIQNGLKQGDDLSPLLFNFYLEYAMRNIQKDHVRLGLNRSRRLLAYVDDMNLLGGNVPRR
jgi:hypothetical protein